MSLVRMFCEEVHCPWPRVKKTVLALKFRCSWPEEDVSLLAFWTRVLIRLLLGCPRCALSPLRCSLLSDGKDRGLRFHRAYPEAKNTVTRFLKRVNPTDVAAGHTPNASDTPGNIATLHGDCSRSSPVGLLSMTILCSPTKTARAHPSVSSLVGTAPR